jgi:hypothetical protein
MQNTCIPFKLQGPNGEDRLGKGLCLVESGISMDLVLDISWSPEMISHESESNQISCSAWSWSWSPPWGKMIFFPTQVCFNCKISWCILHHVSATLTTAAPISSAAASCSSNYFRTIYIQEFAALSWLDAVNCRSASSAEVKTHLIHIIVILCAVCVVVLLVQQLGLILHYFELQFDEQHHQLEMSNNSKTNIIFFLTSLDLIYWTLINQQNNL